MLRVLGRLLQDEDGQDLIEYALLGSFVSLAAYGGANALGGGLNGWYSAIDSTIEAASSAVPDLT